MIQLVTVASRQQDGDEESLKVLFCLTGNELLDELLTSDQSHILNRVRTLVRVVFRDWGHRRVNALSNELGFLAVKLLVLVRRGVFVGLGGDR